MARIDRYILARLTIAFGFFALVLVLVYWVNRAVLLFDQLIGDGQSGAVFLELTLLTLPNLIRMVLPIAGFAAALYVTNRLAEGSELTVVQATGFSPLRLARPYALYGLGVAVLTITLSTVLAPAAQHQLRLRQAEVADNATARLLREGQFLSPTEGVTLYLRDVTPAGELIDLFLTDRRSANETVTYTAARAYLIRSDRGPQLVMIDGLIQTLRLQDQRLVTTSFTDLAYDIGGLVRDPRADRRSAREMPTALLLWPDEAVMAEAGRTRGELLAEGHDRFAQGLVAFAAALIGFATLIVGGFSRFGIWRQIVAAIGLVVLVKLIESGTTAAVRGNAALWPLSYLPGLIGLTIALGLLAKAGGRRRAQVAA